MILIFRLNVVFCFYFSDHPEFEGTTADIINHLLFDEEKVSLIGKESTVNFNELHTPPHVQRAGINILAK